MADHLFKSLYGYHFADTTMKHIYVDGSAMPNPGYGGYGVAVLNADKQLVVSKSFSHDDPHATNNQMELRAAITAFDYIDDGEHATIYTDSTYVQQGITSWIVKWRNNGWCASNKNPVKNVDLWKQLDKQREKHPNVSFKWVKGHNGDKWNDHVDKLAKDGVQTSMSLLQSP